VTASAPTAPAIAPAQPGAVLPRDHHTRDIVVGIIVLIAFIAVHLYLYKICTGYQRVGASDVTLYQYWAWRGKALGEWPVINTNWVYPAAALIPVWLAGVVTPANGAVYMGCWFVLVTLLDALACLVLLASAPARRAYVAIGFWLLFLVALGSTGVTRLDSIIAPITVMALVAAIRHTRLASVLLTLGAWIKVVPGAIVISLFALARKRFYTVILPCFIVSAVTVGLAWLLGGTLGNIMSFFTSQSDRGLQIEAVASTPFVLAKAIAGQQTWSYNTDLGCVEVAGAHTGAPLVVAHLLNYVLILLALLIGWLAFRARHRGYTALLIAALATMSGMIVTDKVGSPQYMAWLAPPVVAALAWRKLNRRWAGTAGLLLAIAVLTQLIYPLYYNPLLENHWPMLLVYTARNLAVVVLFVLAVFYLWRLGNGRPRGGAGTDARPGRWRGFVASWRAGELTAAGLVQQLARDVFVPSYEARDDGVGVREADAREAREAEELRQRVLAGEAAGLSGADVAVLQGLHGGLGVEIGFVDGASDPYACPPVPAATTATTATAEAAQESDPDRPAPAAATATTATEIPPAADESGDERWTQPRYTEPE
jgi:hypothetical protein